MNFIKKTFKKRPIISVLAVVVVIIILGLLIFSDGKASEQTMVVKRADFVNEVSVSGKVIAAQNAELGFDESGRVSAIYVKVGDNVKMWTTIASIENGTARANIAQKQAALEREQAKLSALQKGTRKEELDVYEQKYIDASSALIIAMRDAYLQIENAAQSKVDLIFDNGTSVYPTIKVNAQGDTEKRRVESGRLILGEKLQKWRVALNALSAKPSADDIRSVRTMGNDTIVIAKDLIDRLTVITSNLAPGNSGMSQDTIDTYRSTINSAGQQVSAAASSEQNSYAAWSSAYNSLVLEKAGSTAEDISAQTAEVKSAEADLVNAQAQLRKTLIIAPFDGIVSKMNLKVGEIVSPSTSEVSMMSVGAFEIESYVPEINISRIKVNDPASITLDAYGTRVSFGAKIISIDPAETLKDGVSTYKTRLLFTDNDPRIKSGMTANIRIITEKKSDVITIPKSIVSERDGKKFVKVKNGDTVNEVEVMTGSSSGLGQVEITSGLSEGDRVILPPLKEN